MACKATNPVQAYGLTMQIAAKHLLRVASLSDITKYCDDRIRIDSIADFKGAENGLQFQNNGQVNKIGAAVDAGIVPFQKAVDAGINFLIVHHGLFWEPAYPITESRYEKYKLCLESNLAVYGAHLPLDCHPEIGNNAIFAQKLKLRPERWFLEFEGTPVGVIAGSSSTREALKMQLKSLFPAGVTAIEKGSENPEKIAIVTGSGVSAISELKAEGVDTLITGELKQHTFNQAEEQGLNLYLCGHYATETFGVKALAAEVSSNFGLDWEFIETDCPL